MEEFCFTRVRPDNLSEVQSLPHMNPDSLLKGIAKTDATIETCILKYLIYLKQNLNDSIEKNRKLEERVDILTNKIEKIYKFIDNIKEPTAEIIVDLQHSVSNVDTIFTLIKNI